MKANDDSNMDLFADVLTITLSMLLLVAIILAMDSSSGSSSLALLEDPDLVSELEGQQLREAQRASAGIEIELEQRLGLKSEMLKTRFEQSEALAMRSIEAADEKALELALRDYRNAQREAVNTVRLDVAERTVRRKVADFRARNDLLERKVSAAQEKALRLLKERADTAGLLPFYVVFKEGKAYPLSKVERGKVVRNRDVAGWIEVEKRGEATALFPDESGYGPSEALEYAGELAKESRLLRGRRIVVLVFGDSFREARGFLKALSGSDLEFGWEPWADGKPVVLSASGRMPYGAQ